MMRHLGFRQKNDRRKPGAAGLLVLLACVGGASCSQDELAGNRQGTPLPAGEYPLELTAGGPESVATPVQASPRGTFFEGDWDGVTGVRVRVNDQQEKEYSVTPSEDKKTARLAPAQPLEITDELFWWTNTGDEKTITAWAPSEYKLNETIEFPTEWTREDFAKYDIIGVRKTIGFENRNAPLEFQHMMAKFVINLRKTPYLENAGNVKVQLDGASWKYGHMYIDSYRGLFQMGNKAGQYGEYITPYHLPEADYEDVDFGSGSPEKPFASYMALVPPLDGKVNPLLIIEVDGVKYQLLQDSFTEEYNVSYRGGQVYTFNVTVKEKGLEVAVEETIGWNTGNTGNGSITLPVEIKPTDEQQTFNLKNGDVYIIRGEGKEGFLFNIPQGETATIELNDVKLDSGDKNPEFGLNLNGGGTFILKLNGTNTLKGFRRPIISGYNDSESGNIQIEGPGTLKIEGDNVAMGIVTGGGKSITIKNATIDMDYSYSSGNYPGAAIGSNAIEECGDITMVNSDISIDVELVNFDFNIYYGAVIGAGGGKDDVDDGGICGNIDITLSKTESSKKDFLNKIHVKYNEVELSDNQKVGKGPTSHKSGTVTWRNSDGTVIETVIPK